MSKRVTTDTEIKDRSIALDAFKSCGLHFQETSPTTFEIRAGRSVGMLDLRTGQIVGDDMSFQKKDFEALKQHYAEEKYVWELRQQGATIHSREVNEQGDIVLMYQTA